VNTTNKNQNTPETLLSLDFQKSGMYDTGMNAILNRLLATLDQNTVQLNLISQAILPNLGKAGLPLNKRAFLSTNEAMEQVGYRDKPTFLKAMARHGIPHIALSNKKFVWDPEELNRWKNFQIKNERGPYTIIT
jgi:hypothetical protein